MLLLYVVVATLFALCSATDVTHSFRESVINDDRVWLVEFYSEMCGSCKEFAPTWDMIEQSLPNMSCGKVNIDTPEGMKIAQELNVLEEGIPIIKLFYDAKVKPGKSIIVEGQTHSSIVSKVRKSVSHNSKRDDGKFVKILDA